MKNPKETSAGAIFLCMFERRERRERQDEFWVQADKMPAAAPSAFYRRLNATLERMEFAGKVWAICEPAYADHSRGGRAGMGPGGTGRTGAGGAARRATPGRRRSGSSVISA